MATPRLPFLYPNFFRAVRSCEPTTRRSLRAPPPPAPAKPTRKAHFHSAARRPQDAIPQRYGQAATQNLPPPAQQPESSDRSRSKDEQGQEQQPQDEGAALQADQGNKDTKETEVIRDDQEAAPRRKRVHAESVGQDEPQDTNAVVDYIIEESPNTGDKSAANSAAAAAAADSSSENKELDMVLSVPSSSDLKSEFSTRHPHLEPSPYVHHFDTYSLVQQLGAKDAYTLDQSITLMKAIRLMLALNLDVAKEGLVSKSNIENESYLFRAACSELRTTLQTARHSETLTQRTQRAQLQHEFEVLNQKVTQDLVTLREELKGLFNDRKLGLQEEKRKIDGKISELNYEITVLLNSEAKSEVEGLRWVLTRRAAMAIGFCAFMIISTLNYASIKSREKEEAEKKRKAAQKADEERIARNHANNNTPYTVPSRSAGTQTESAMVVDTLG